MLQKFLLLLKLIDAPGKFPDQKPARTGIQ
jgi:hypothetical protein